MGRAQRALSGAQCAVGRPTASGVGRGLERYEGGPVHSSVACRPSRRIAGLAGTGSGLWRYRAADGQSACAIPGATAPDDARLRGVSHVAPVGSDAFVALTTLHDGATATPEDLGHFHITQQHREPLRLIRVRLDDRHRRKLTAAHKPARRNDCARANAEPWLLSVSPTLDDLCAHDIVRLYAQRMQIEESFRDLKNERFGHALCHSQTRQAQRMLMLILLDTLASYAAFWLGILARQHTAHRRLFPHRQAAKRSTPQLSIIRIGRELLRRHPAWRPPWPPDIQTLRAAQEALYA